ncbi:MAG: glycoside hydrolase family 3 N-terminal domain-containing protein [Ignavibacteria bacterium]
MKIILAIPLLIASAITYFSLKDQVIEKKQDSDITKTEAFIYTLPSDKLITKKLSSMTLREKIAQMVIGSAIPDNFSETSADFKKLKRLCKQTKIGGFIFFKGSSADYSRLSNYLQSFSETPLLISADFERGTKMRVTDGVIFPNNMAIGAANNPELCYKMGLEIARETRLLGIHQNYAPVCDVNNNPNNPIINVRSFGEDPKLVSKMSESMIKGLQEGKVIATVKHFPGHGDTEIDSHNDLPVLNFSMDRLSEIELVPFKNAIDKGVMSVMIAHLSFPELEQQPNIPASLSPSIVEGLLINKMGFSGLVVTDALNMKGITKYFSNSEVAVMCVQAGIDLILMNLNEEGTVDAIEAAVMSGKISEDRINRSAEKILKTKQWLGLFDNRSVQETDIYNSVNTASANELAQQIADESITLVKDDNSILPLKNESGKKTAVIAISEGGEQDNTAYMVNILSGYFSNYEYVSTGPNSIEPLLEEKMKLISDYDLIIVAVYAKVRFGTGKISISPVNVDLINSLRKLNKNLVVLSLGNPYLLKEFPDAPCYICAYGDSDVSINASLRAITGKTKFKGKLPVTITETFTFGTGINK